MKKHAIAVFVLLIVTCQHAVSQTTEPDFRKQAPKKSYWFDLGFGWGGQGAAFDIGLTYELAHKRLLSLRYAEVTTADHCSEIVFFFPIANPLGKSARSFEVSYGFLKKGRAGILNVSAGLSYVNVETADGSDTGGGQGLPPLYYTNCPADYSSKEESTAGLALRAQYIPCIRWAGLGFSPYININPKYVFGSFTINVAVGRLRSRAND